MSEVDPPGWVYRVETLYVSKHDAGMEEIESILNQLGELGWELVAIEPLPRTRNITEAGERTLIAFLKQRWRG